MVLPLEILIVLAVLSAGIRPLPMVMVTHSFRRIRIIHLTLLGVAFQALVGGILGALIRSTLPTVFMVAASTVITFTVTTTFGIMAPTTIFRLLMHAAVQALIITTA